jgi:hypothetical protein
MLDSLILWCGAFALGGGILALPWRRTRRRGAIAVIVGALMIAIALAIPVREQRATERATKLDEIAPRWQFDEHHEIDVNASPERVDRAIRDVRANEIALFDTLTTIRRGFRKSGENILNAGNEKPLLEVATKSGFEYVADEPRREIVIATHIGNGGRATMNFLITPNGGGGTRLSTDTRVFLNDAKSRRAFTVYWRIIHPGSDIIRRMWLRAIKKRAEAS